MPYKYTFTINRYITNDLLNKVSKNMQDFTGEDFELSMGGEFADVHITSDAKLEKDNIKTAEEELSKFFQEKWDKQEKDIGDIVVKYRAKYKSVKEVKE